MSYCAAILQLNIQTYCSVDVSLVEWRLRSRDDIDTLTSTVTDYNVHCQISNTSQKLTSPHIHKPQYALFQKKCARFYFQVHHSTM